jgi:membrane fusion protein (multidrug efflux system)
MPRSRGPGDAFPPRRAVSEKHERREDAMSRFTYKVLATLMLSLAPGIAGCSSHAEAADEQPDGAVAPPTPVTVRAAETVERPIIVAASGTVDANTTADLGFKVSGRAAVVLADEGETVRAGQLLASLDATDYRLSADQAAASAAQAADEFARMRELFSRGSLAPNDFKKFETATQVAESQSSLARQRLADTRLTAPIAGVIARRAVDAGEMVGAGTPVFTIVAVDPVEIRVGIPEVQVGGIKLGAPARITIPALAGEEFQAKVGMIGVAADPASRTYPVKLVVSNSGRALLPGMIAEARINGDRMVRAITVPGEAVVRDADGATLVFVYFPKERRVYGRRVTVGALIGREVEITSGLQPSDLVVVGGQQRLRDGVLVSATADASTAGDSSTRGGSSR